MDQGYKDRINEIVDASGKARRVVTALFAPASGVLPDGHYFHVGAAYLYATVKGPQRQRASILRQTTLYTGTDELPEMPEVPVILLDARPQPVVIENNRLLASAPDEHEFDVFRLPARVKPYITVSSADVVDNDKPAPDIQYVATLDVGFPNGEARTYWLANLKDHADVERYVKVALLEYLRMPRLTPAAVPGIVAALTPTQQINLRLDEGAYKLVLTITPREGFSPISAH